MGRPMEFENTNLIRNGLFSQTWPWVPVPPWIVSGGKAHWHFHGATGANALTQTTYAGADLTYVCHFQADISVAGRTFSFHLADVNKAFAGGVRVLDETFELTPTVPGDFSLGVGVAYGPGGEVDIWDIEVIGIPVGDPMYDMLYENGLAPAIEAYTEYYDLGGGKKIFSIAGWADASHCLIKEEI